MKTGDMRPQVFLCRGEAGVDQLYRLIESLSGEEVEDLLDYLELRAEPDTLNDDEMARVIAGRDEIARGEFVTLEEIQRRRTAE